MGPPVCQQGGSVVLQFEEEKLARWKVFAPPPREYPPPGEKSEQMRDLDRWMQQQAKDSRHHKKGHAHHHDQDDSEHHKKKGHIHHHDHDPFC